MGLLKDIKAQAWDMAGELVALRQDCQ